MSDNSLRMNNQTEIDTFISFLPEILLVEVTRVEE